MRVIWRGRCSVEVGRPHCLLVHDVSLITRKNMVHQKCSSVKHVKAVRPRVARARGVRPSGLVQAEVGNHFEREAMSQNSAGLIAGGRLCASAMVTSDRAVDDCGDHAGRFETFVLIVVVHSDHEAELEEQYSRKQGQRDGVSSSACGNGTKWLRGTG